MPKIATRRYTDKESKNKGSRPIRVVRDAPSLNTFFAVKNAKTGSESKLNSQQRKIWERVVEEGLSTFFTGPAGKQTRFLSVQKRQTLATQIRNRKDAPADIDNSCIEREKLR